MHEHGRTWSKDEDRLADLESDEARSVMATRDALLTAVGAGEPPFVSGHARWRIRDELRALPAGSLLTLG